jgi:hypothetical protein
MGTAMFWGYFVVVGAQYLWNENIKRHVRILDYYTDELVNSVDYAEDIGKRNKVQEISNILSDYLHKNNMCTYNKWKKC